MTTGFTLFKVSLAKILTLSDRDRVPALGLGGAMPRCALIEWSSDEDLEVKNDLVGEDW
jgi:hypothetical protein